MANQHQQDAIERMFRVLVGTLQTKQPALLSAPFTVADIHQQILPYRHFRKELELDTNQEYELTLMALLSGAGGFLEVDEKLRDELGKELARAEPEPSRVREFADAQVAISPVALEKISGVRAVKPAAAGRTGTSATAAGPATASSAPAAGVAANVTGRCRYCGGELPTGRTVHYCPHCGQNLQVLNCTACGAEVEAGWKFCVSCGKSVA